MIVTVTERGTWRRCRRRWDLGSWNRQNLTPIGSVSKALDLGSLAHKSLADWTLDPSASLVELFKKHSSIRLIELETNYKALTGGAKPSVDEIAPLLDAVELGLKMMANYQAYHKTPLPRYMKWVAPEQKILVPIPGTEGECETCGGDGHPTLPPGNWVLTSLPDHCYQCKGTTCHFLEGTLDALIQDERDRLFVLERKTYSRRPRIETLAANDQFLAYLWILTQLDIGPVGGIAYDGMWKKEKPTAKYPLSELFIRATLERTADELAEFEGQLREEVREMASIHGSVPIGSDSPRLYINRRWEGCLDCNFDKLCRTMSRGEDAEYIKRTFYTSRGKAEEAPLEMAADPY